jgi:hypothetical protein
MMGLDPDTPLAQLSKREIVQNPSQTGLTKTAERIESARKKSLAIPAFCNKQRVNYPLLE